MAKTALVTGAASGIGKAIAEAFAEAGYRVIRVDKAPLDSPDSFQVDLSDRSAVRVLAETVLDRSGGVDVLVNNAGFQHVAPLEEFPPEVWETMLSVMVTAPFLLIRAFLPGMKVNGWGRIINLGSIHSVVASPFKAGYVSAKHALLGLTKVAALEGGPFGVTANAICPAYVRTPLVEGQIADQARSLGISEGEVIEKVMLEPAAIKRLIEPEEVAALALFLATDAAGAITGACLPQDLGWTAR